MATEIVREPSGQFAGLSAAEYAAALEPVKVKIRAPWRVVHDGKPYTDGDQVEVPGHLAGHWERSGWAERVKPRTVQTKEEKK